MATRLTSNFAPTEDQERDLVEYCLQRIDSLKQDNRARIEADQKAKLSYKNSREHRKQDGGLFAQSNLVLPLSSMIAESFISRTEEELFGVDPFFKSEPRGAKDVQLAKECDAYFRFKFGDSQARVKSVFEQAVAQSFLQRAVIIKVIKGDKLAEWMDNDTAVLFDRATNEPVKIAGKSPEEPTAYVAEDTAEWDEAEQAPMVEGGPVVIQSVLRADPTIIWNPEKYEFRPLGKPLLREAVLFRGAKAVLVDYDAFLNPSTAPDAQESDMCAHLYDKPLSWVAERFIERPWLTWESFKAQYQTETAKAKTETERNRDNGETLAFDDKTKMLPLVECWVRRDVLGWGRPQEFMVLIEPVGRRAAYYEFQAKLCPDMLRPFETYAIAPEDGRWWGENLMEKLDQYQEYVDKQFNRESVRNIQNANPIGGVHPDACEEEPDEIDLGDGGLFRLKTGKKLSDFIEWSSIPNLDTKTQALLEFVIYLVQLWLSVSNLSQGDYAELPQNSTKFGIQATLREASKLGRRFIRRTKDSFVRTLTKMVKLQIDQLDTTETFEVTEGEDRALVSLSEDRIKQLRKLDVNVSLLLTQQSTEADVQAAKMALETSTLYFQTPDPMKAAVRPLYVKIFEALGFKDTDKLLPLPVLLPAPGVPGQPMNPQDAAAGQMPAEEAGEQPGAPDEQEAQP